MIIKRLKISSQGDDYMQAVKSSRKQSPNPYIGSHLSWDKAVGLFPDTWLAFKDGQYDKATFLGGTLVAVIPSGSVSKYMHEHLGEGLYVVNTEEGSLEGVTDGVLYYKATE